MIGAAVLPCFRLRHDDDAGRDFPGKVEIFQKSVFRRLKKRNNGV